MRVAGATDVHSYLAGLPADRRATIETVRALVKKTVPKGIEEGFGYGMITWSVPLSFYPVTYNGKPLMFAALASQKNSHSLYLMSVYGDARIEERLRDGFKQAGKKLDMGKSCIRFKSVEDLPLPVIAEALAATTMEKFVAVAREAHAKRKRK